MGKRAILRYIPGLRRLAAALDNADRDRAWLVAQTEKQAAEVAHLKRLLAQVLFTDAATEQDGVGQPDGVPVPPAVLRFLVAGTDDRDWFLRSGPLGVQALTAALGRHGRTLEGCKAILDFGCGCGRVVRHLNRLPGVAVHGTDSNPLGPKWCATNLPFGTFGSNPLAPPMSYPDDTFDLIYAFSIFTHLTEPIQLAWMAEFRRVLAPGGVLALSVHGDATTGWMTDEQKRRYHAGEVIVSHADTEGTNFCGAFNSEAHVRRVLGKELPVLDFLPQGALGNPPQDLYLFRK